MDVPFDEYAEDLFLTFCSAPGVGARAQFVRRDKTGWDYLVEFADSPHDGPAEAAPAPLRAFVQVKSSVKESRKVRVKLSNAQRMASDQNPWFIVYIVAKPRGQIEVYCIHIWANVLSDMLKAIRKADQADKPLHRQTITFECQTAPMVGPEAVQWIRQTIEEQGLDYGTKKQQMVKTFGYEHGYGTGRFTVEIDYEDQFLDMLLGVPGAKVKIKDFAFVESRFGIVASKPNFELTDGVMSVEPQPVVDCEVRLKSFDGLVEVTLPAKGYSAALPEQNPGNLTIRIATDFADFKIKADGTVTFGINAIPPSELKTLAMWQKIFAAYHCLAKDKFDIQFWAGRRRLSHGEFTCKYELSPQLDALETAVEGLCSIARGSSDSISISLGDLNLYRSPAMWIHQIMSAPSFRSEFCFDGEIDLNGRALLYYFAVPVGNYHYCALVKRLFLNMQNDGKKYSMIFGKAEVLESYAVSGALDDARSMIFRDHEQMFSISGSKQLSIGDLVAAVNTKEYAVRISDGHD